MLSPRTQILVVVFSVIDPKTLNTIMLQFLPIRKSKSEETLLLIGMNAKERDPNDKKHVSEEQAKQALKNLKGCLYLEIEDHRDIGVLLQHCAKAILRKEKTEKNKNSNFISKLVSIQKSVENRETIEKISMKRCKLEFLPPLLLQFTTSLTRLKLTHNIFKFFPEEVIDFFINIFFIIM